MKGFILWAVFAMFYILIILLFQVSAQVGPSAALPNNGFPPASGNQNNNFNNGNAATQNQSILQTIMPAMTWDNLGITDPSVRQTLTNIYGTLLGRPDCIKKSICNMGSYFHNLPGRDIIFTMASRYVPQEWGLLYDIFRVSVMYGQNCDVYICDPENTQQQFPSSPLASNNIPTLTTTPAPTLNRFFSMFSGQQTTTTTTTTAIPSQQQSNEIEDNSIHKVPNSNSRSFF